MNRLTVCLGIAGPGTTMPPGNMDVYWTVKAKVRKCLTMPEYPCGAKYVVEASAQQKDPLGRVQM